MREEGERRRIRMQYRESDDRRERKKERKREKKSKAESRAARVLGKEYRNRDI